MEEIKFKKQQEILTSWIDDPRHAANAACHHSLELYAQLNDSEFLYVSDLQSTYDEARCFFLQWVLGKEIKELVNSARISAVQAGKKFTWRHARDEVLRSLTDITYNVRFLALARLKRQSGSAAKIWISQVLTRKALLEDPKLPSPIALPEALYRELLVGQMSAQETTVFDCPSIGDDLSAKDHRGRAKYTLARIKQSIDDCSNPPHFRGVKTPVTDILDQAPLALVKEKRDQTKEYSRKEPPKAAHPANEKREYTKPNPSNAHLTRHPDHEQPSSTATKSPPTRNVSFMTTLNAATARAAIKEDTFAKTAKIQKRNGRTNLTKKNFNTGIPSSNGKPVPPLALSPLPHFIKNLCTGAISIPKLRQSPNSAQTRSRLNRTRTIAPPSFPSITV
jgi:hypothetical protein